MSLQELSIPDLGPRDAGFALVWLLALVLLVPVQLASIIVFDSTGFDTVVPDVVFVTVVPGLALATLLTLVARRLYARRTTRTTAAVAFVIFALVATYTRQFYAMCGPGC